ncbi:MAG: metallophosphoesterase family protein [Bacteroidales bacterium]
MRQIGLISDTHSYLHPDLPEIFRDCDEIWHAGDFGGLHVAEALQAIKPLRGVYGNIDDQEVRAKFPRMLRFRCEDCDVLMTHIGGYPGRYERNIREMMKVEPPDIFISGHSHILKVMPDKKNDLLHINPGAAGRSGFHKAITIVRFIIDKRNVKDLEVLEIKKN